MIKDCDFKSKIKSKGEGRGLGVGKGKGPIGTPVGIKLSPITLGQITRLLRTVKNLAGTAYVVGGLVTEGSTLRDIDVVITEPVDRDKIIKALGKFGDRAHILIQKKEPPAPLKVKITGETPKSPELYRKKSKYDRIPRNEYAS